MARDERPGIHFDRQDHELVEMVNDLTLQGGDSREGRLRHLLTSDLHPRGIKELVATRPQRIAYSVVRLLDSLDTGKARERLDALRALHDELVEGAEHSLPLNTSRVLVEIMKHLVRERGNATCQLRLAHEFFLAASGRPKVVRRNLHLYHLLEMSEDWNQVAFDHHVHDANTKGRKSPTHLVVDAWVKGIREMTVVYYNFITPDTLAELVEAAAIMGVSVQPGVEVAARFRGKFVQFIWQPQGLHGTREYLALIDRPAIRGFFEEGREVAAHKTRYVLDMVRSFNEHHLAGFNAEHGLTLPPLDEAQFLQFVGIGQPSRSHLAEYVAHRAIESASSHLPAWRRSWQAGSADERGRIETIVARLDALTPEAIARHYLTASANPELHDPSVPVDGEDVPFALKLPAGEALRRLAQLRAGSRITLNPSNLTRADVVEILYDGDGAVTDVEIFNLKDYRRKRNPEYTAIAEVPRILNSGNPIACKRMLQDVLRDVERSAETGEAKADRLAKLHAILADLQRLLACYADDPLGAQIGSDSIGRARDTFGMGLALMDSLPRRALRAFRRHPGTREVVPVATEVALRTTWKPRRSHIGAIDRTLALTRRVPLIGSLGFDRVDSFIVNPSSTHLAATGNLITLGGTPEKRGNGLLLEAPCASGGDNALRWRYLNSRAKSFLKIALGLIPAILTFALTKDWWLLAYFGAFIWFGITGARNILQTVVGGAGIWRSKKLTWRDLVSWGRVADSLLYTGFSVPLLDWLVKSVILDRSFGVTTATAPLTLYSVMALTNGVYLFSHNTFRGLPRAAAIGNLFRALLSIPFALLFNWLAQRAMLASGMELAAANLSLQAWAAVIGKLASDTVAGFIEGAADRNVNISQRHRDVRSKLRRLLQVHGELEAMLPELDVAACLASPKEFFRSLGTEARALERHQIVNALDLMYFWTYQPRARAVFEHQLLASSPEERSIILRTQRLLERKRTISELFLADLLGKNFSPPLAFYLNLSASYLRDMRRLAEKCGVDWGAHPPRSSEPPSNGMAAAG